MKPQGDGFLLSRPQGCSTIYNATLTAMQEILDAIHPRAEQPPTGHMHWQLHPLGQTRDGNRHTHTRLHKAHMYTHPCMLTQDMHTQSTLLFTQHHMTYTLTATNSQAHVHTITPVTCAHTITCTKWQTNRTQRSQLLDPLCLFLSHRGDPPAMFDWFFEAACPASLQEGE